MSDAEGYDGSRTLITRADLSNLQVFLDGSGEAMWPSRNTLEEAASDEGSASRHFVRLADLLRLFDKPAGVSDITP